MFISSSKFVNVITSLGVMCVLSACQVLPTVSYKVFNASDGDFEGYNKFKLSSSLILIDKPADEKKIDAITIRSVLAEDPSNTVYGVVPADQPGVSTAMNVTARENTMLVESIGTDIKDNRVKFIQDLGSAIVMLAGFSALENASGCRWPEVIDISDYLSAHRRDKYTQKGALKNGCDFVIDFGPIPPDAILRDKYPFTKRQHTLFYSACRDATIKINTGDKASVISAVRIADPNFLQTVVYPAKGKITMHSSCGVSTQSELVETATGLEILNALIAQAKSIRDAQNASQ
jgi:hypothetical protein